MPLFTVNLELFTFKLFRSISTLYQLCPKNPPLIDLPLEFIVKALILTLVIDTLLGTTEAELSLAPTSAISPPTLELLPVCLSVIFPPTVTLSNLITGADVDVTAPTIPITPPRQVQSTFVVLLLYVRFAVTAELVNETSLVASSTYPTRPPTKLVYAPLGDAVTSAVTLSIVKAPLLYADTEPI